MFEMEDLERDRRLLERLAGLQREINRLTAEQLAVAAEFATGRPAPTEPIVPGGETARWGQVSEFASAEIAAALGLTRSGADRLLSLAYAVDALPATRALFAGGELDRRRAQVIADAAADLDDDARAAVEATVLPRAAGQTVPQLAAALRRAVLRHAPAAVNERQQRAHAERAVWAEHGGDGCSRLVAEGPTHQVLRIAAAVTAVARTLDVTGGSLDQRRFDALTQLADIILDDPALPKTRFGRPGLVLLADTAARARLADAGAADLAAADQDVDQDVDQSQPEPSERLAELLGAGVIPDRLARVLFADRHTTVVCYDPTLRWPCDHSHGYVPSEKLARQVAAAHRYCCFPGCRIPAHACDLDHVVPWPTGPTCACNLIPLCRYHHRLKTHTRWQVNLHPDRRINWTTPTGATHIVYPDEDPADTTTSNHPAPDTTIPARGRRRGRARPCRERRLASAKQPIEYPPPRSQVRLPGEKDRGREAFVPCPAGPGWARAARTGRTTVEPELAASTPEVGVE